MAEQTQQKEGGQKSGFGHHMLEAERVIQMKQLYEQKILTSDFSNFIARDEALSFAKIQASEIRSLASVEERLLMSQIIAQMERCSNNIQGNQYVADHASIGESEKALMMAGAISAFKTKLHEFLDCFIQVQDRANLQFIKLKEQGEMAKYLSFNEVDIRFINKEGIYISPQMEFFCRGLALRARHNQNNIIIISAKMGKGKSTFALSGATTLSAMLGVPFSIDTNIVLNESREQCERLIATLPHGSSLIFDQAGNQMGAASRMEDDQINLLNKVDLNRFHNLTLWVNWHAAKALDKDIRERVSTLEVAIDKVGGPAIIKGFNLNPLISGPVVSQKDRKKVALTPDQAHTITEGDMLKLIEVPFFPMDKNCSPEALKLWEAYSYRKERSNKFMRKIVGKSSGVDLFYNDFLASLDENVVRISSESLEAYGQSKATYLSMRELGKRIARATNQKFDMVFKNTNLLNLNEGYIEVDRYAGEYIRRLRSEKQGALQFAKEQEEKRGD
jgi:hypothetical protein